MVMVVVVIIKIKASSNNCDFKYGDDNIHFPSAI
jgi:hypothetical protein